jgi:hypothetical protein
MSQRVLANDWLKALTLPSVALVKCMKLKCSLSSFSVVRLLCFIKRST